tara:strand:- start:227 stop:559 length:333 start_codon:yes stop_codon:yes gene_type:complete
MVATSLASRTGWTVGTWQVEKQGDAFGDRRQGTCHGEWLPAAVVKIHVAPHAFPARNGNERIEAGCFGRQGKAPGFRPTHTQRAWATGHGASPTYVDAEHGQTESVGAVA